MGVAIGPGTTAFTLIPNGASSSAATLVKPRLAHFDATYDASAREHADRRGRERIHDRTSAYLPEVRHDGLNPEERAEAVHPPDVLERLGTLLVERCCAQHTGVVDQDVDVAEGFETSRHHVVPRGTLTNIELPRHDNAGAELIGQGRELFASDVTRDDPSPLGCKAPSNLPPLAAGCTGDDGDLPVEAHSGLFDGTKTWAYGSGAPVMFQ